MHKYSPLSELCDLIDLLKNHGFKANQLFEEDKLSMIKGVGEKMMEKLNGEGITTLSHLKQSCFDDERMNQIVRNMEVRYNQDVLSTESTRQTCSVENVRLILAKI